MRRPRSIRLRLAVTSALIAAVVLALLTLVVTMEVRAAANASATALARSDLLSYATDLRMQPDEGPDLPATGLLVSVTAPDGRVRRTTMPEAVLQASSGMTGDGVVTTAAGRFAVVSRTVRTPSGTWRLASARDLTPSDAVLAGISATMLIGTPLAAAAVGVAAWLVASAALRPVERLRVAAERLRRGSGRLPVEGARELTELAATMNGLVDSLRDSVAHERRLAADAAHELRTPLAVLAAQVERAGRRADAEQLAGIGASVARLTRLADSLLVLSRTETEGEAVGRATVAELVTEAMEVVDRARLLGPPTILLDLELDEGLDERGVVRIDPTGFGRVLTNLVQNALAAGPASAVVVRLRTAGRDLEVAVRDDGPGVDPAFLPFAFDRFARSEGARSAGGTGSGLGLALVRRLAERAGGRATLENAVDGGAVARVRFPVERGGPIG